MAEQVNRYKKLFEGFELNWKFAVKYRRFGRASGGVLIGVKNTIKSKNISYNFLNTNEFVYLAMQVNQLKFSIIPIYLRGEHWNVDFQELKTLLRDVEIANPILIGDHNVRIGREQQEIDDVYIVSSYTLKNIDNLFQKKNKNLSNSRRTLYFILKIYLSLFSDRIFK